MNDQWDKARESLSQISSFEQCKVTVPKRWLALVQAPSLTRFLKRLSPIFSVQLTYFGRKELLSADKIGGELLLPYMVREVSLLLDNVEVVRARSSCLPEDKFWVDFLDCGEKSIGEKLFHIKQLSRDKFHYGWVASHNTLVKSHTVSDVLYRQSCFKVTGQTLILTECFLQGIEQFLA